MKPDRLPEKLELTLKALVLSRAALAQALEVDKSLVGRWVSGKVTPSEHNLAALTRHVALTVPGFTLMDWELDLPAFASRMGLDRRAAPSRPRLDGWFPASLLDEAAHSGRHRGVAYEGLWRSTRPSIDLPGRFIHDISMVSRRPDGLLGFRVGIEGVRYQGCSFLLQHQLFSIAADADASTLLFTIFNGVARERAQVIDGVTLATLRDAGGSPAASACVLERIDELSGDEDEDDARFEAAVAAQPALAPEGSVSARIADHLTGNASGAPDGMLVMRFAASMARGAVLS
ncbi:helix-turn-helix transcriptional regulator [Glycocaulis profundi]|nr:helix-turn-helix transcriptional regulator [Glycocaulis profundi]